MAARSSEVPDAEVPDDGPTASSAPSRGRERLAVVRPRRTTVYRTFADGELTERSGPVWRREVRRVPDGLVHAAELQGRQALCGTSLEVLHEFGRSRYPFERFDETLRCSACHVAAGRPIG